jgi:hypothetical protein
VTTPAQWAELVTTALLGTDRRPLEAADQPAEVLRAAARHRVLDRLGVPPPVGPDPLPPTTADRATEPDGPAAPGRPSAPGASSAADLPVAPGSADRLLSQLLGSPDPALISCWLQACVAHRRSVAAVHWTPLARLAARTTAYDRRALGGALGPRGRWFLHQNPEWRRLAADADRCTEPVADTPSDPAPALTAEDVLADPERLLRQPRPWAPELVAAAYAVLGGEGQAPPPRSFASQLGVALPAALYPSIARAGEFYLLNPDASPARRRTIRDRFVTLELAAYARAAVDHAFGADGQTTDRSTGFPRAEIPHV